MEPDLSIVVPFLNEAASLPILKERLTSLAGLPLGCEVVLVSDGSTDGSVAFAEAWTREDARVRLVVLSRNFGHQAAIGAGLDFARGRHVGVMDADLQDRPEALLEMWRAALEGSWDVVYGVRARREGSPAKRAAYGAFYWAYTRLAETPVDADSGDFCVLSRRAVSLLAALPERSRFLRGLRSWLGLRARPWPLERPERAAGTAQYSLPKLAALAASGLTSFSVRPLRAVTLAGLTLCLASVLGAAAYLALYFIFHLHASAPGFTTLVLLMFFMGGFQALTLGVVGEYVGQIFVEVKRRPLYLVERTVNVPDAGRRD